jgi:hypothetical protein
VPRATRTRAARPPTLPLTKLVTERLWR